MAAAAVRRGTTAEPTKRLGGAQRSHRAAPAAAPDRGPAVDLVGGGSSRPGGSVFSTPIPRFNGMSVCWNYNKGGCTRPAHSATACKDPNTSSIFAHVCNFWDPAAKQHCYGTHSRSEPGRH